MPQRWDSPMGDGDDINGEVEPASFVRAIAL